MVDLGVPEDKGTAETERHPLRELLCHWTCRAGYDEHWAVENGSGTLEIRTLTERRCLNGHLWYSRPISPTFLVGGEPAVTGDSETKKCADGNHRWFVLSGDLLPRRETPCTLCGELYGDWQANRKATTP